jgi:predicted ATPase/class 3 adenylate cyclase
MSPSVSDPGLSSRDPGERTNLPLQLTSFVGRGAEIDEVKRLVSESRLVTLTGAGGIGKTRLALEVAAQLLGAYAQGVWLVEFGGLTEPGLVPETVVSALGFMIQSGLTPTDSLVSLLSTRSLLCILDNCEHLIGTIAQLADTLLKHCPELRILATSRDVLGVGGEVTWRVPSMATPDGLRAHALDELRRCETVQLFVQRARAARRGFELNDDNAESVVRICQRVDGIPLAIELIAARTRSMSVRAIDERFADRFNLATGGSRALPRQRTLLATFDWSHELLSEEEKRVFRRLAVFAGGFTLDAAEAVCKTDEAEEANQSPLETLTSIVDKSLVITQEAVGAGERYRLLEPLRQYADDRLSQAQEADSARRSHATFYLALGNEMYRELRGPSQVQWMALAVEDMGNFRACFGWAFRHDTPAALQLAVALERYWIRSSPAEGLEWLRRALELYGVRDELRAHALYDATFWAWYRSDNDAARQYGQECLALAQELGSDLYIGQALSGLATVASSERPEGSLAHSVSLFHKAEQHIRTADDPEALGRILNNFGCTLYEAGDLVGARVKIEEALALARDRNDVWQIGGFLDGLADVEYASGETANAQRDWVLQLELAGQLGSRSTAAYALVGLARLAMADGRPERYVRLLGAANNLLRLAGVVHSDVEKVSADARRESHATLGENMSDEIWRDGGRMSLMDAVRFGLEATHSPEGSTSEITPAIGSEVVERTFMFSDIVRSTELVALIGDAAWHELVEWHHRTLRETFTAHRGEEVDSAGDGFFVAFPTAPSAADCAIALQRALAEHRHSHGFAPFVRLGLHTTVARHSHGGYRGKGVHVAARIAAQAGAGEILVSSATAAELTGHYVLSPPRPATLKGIAEEVLVASLGWR